MTPAQLDWAPAVTAIEGARQVCLACHVRPDADALGSMLAVGQALAARPGPPQVLASFGDDPFTVPGSLSFLPGADLLCPPAACPARPEVMITFDVSSPGRLGALAGPAAAAGELIVVDHHASNGAGFGTIRLVDPAAAASAVLAAELIRRLGADLTRDVALGLYAGLVADTGSFAFEATTPAVHELAARLLATGIDPAAVSRQLYDGAPFGYLRLLAAALDRAALVPSAARGAGLAWTTVTRADRASAGGLGLQAADAVVDVVRRTGDAEVAVVLKEDDQGTWQGSVRSRAVADVSAACAALGGGGHARASGFSFTGKPQDAIDALVAALERP